MSKECNTIIKSFDKAFRDEIAANRDNPTELANIIRKRKQSLSLQKTQLTAGATAQGPAFLKQSRKAIDSLRIPKEEEDTKFNAWIRNVEKDRLENEEVDEVETVEVSDLEFAEALEFLEQYVNHPNVPVNQKFIDKAEKVLEDFQEDFNITGDVDTHTNLLNAFYNHRLRKPFEKAKEVAMLESENGEVVLQIKNKITELAGKEETKDLAEILGVLVHSVPKSQSQMKARNDLVNTIAEQLQSNTPPSHIITNALLDTWDYFIEHGSKSEFGASSELLYLENRIGADYFKKFKKQIPDFSDAAEQFSPREGKEGLISKSKSPRSLFARFPVVHKLFQNSALLSHILPKDMRKLSYSQQKALNEFDAYRSKLEEHIHSQIPDIKFEEGEGRTFHRDKGRHIGEMFNRAPVFYLIDENGKLPANLITAIAAEVTTWMATQGKDTVLNTDGDIASLLGLLNENAVTHEARNRLKNAGSVRSEVARKLGKNIAKHINLKTKQVEGIDGLFQNRLETSLGLVAIEALYNNGDLTHDAIPVKEWQHYAKSWNDIKNKDWQNPDPNDPIINMIRVKTEYVQDLDKVVAAPQIDDIVNNYDGMRKIFTRLFDVQATEKRPLTEDEKEQASKVRRKVNRRTMQLDKRSSDYLKTLQEYPIGFNQSNLDLVQAFNDEDFLEQIMGTRDPKGVLDIHRDSQEAKNEALRREHEIVKEAIADGTDTVRFLYNVQSNFRANINSSGLNYQSGKALHRTILTMKDWEHEISKEELGKFYEIIKQDGTHNWEEVPEGMQQVLVATGFGLGLKTGKQGVDKAVEGPQMWEDYVTALQDPEGVLRPAINLLKKPRKPGAKFSKEEAKIIGAAAQEGGERGWSLFSLNAWAEMENAAEKGESWTNRMPMEVDGLTNGLAIVALQIPNGDEDHIRMMFNRTGVFLDGQEEESIAELIAQDPGFTDSYQDLATRMNEAVEYLLNPTPEPSRNILEMFTDPFTGDFNPPFKKVPQLKGLLKLAEKTDESNLPPAAFTDTLVDAEGKPTKFSRNMAKQPVLTSGVYAAGIHSVLGQIAVSSEYETAPSEQFYIANQKLVDADIPSDSKAIVFRERLQLLHDAVVSEVPKDLLDQLNSKDPKERKQAKREIKNNYAHDSDFPIPTVAEIKTTYAKDVKNTGKDPVDEFIRKYKIPDKTKSKGWASPLESLQNRTAGTFGAFALGALGSMLGPQQAVRNELLADMQLMANIATEVYKQRIIDFVEKHDAIPSDQQDIEIQRAIQEEGWGTIFQAPNSETNDLSTWINFSSDADIELESFYEDLLGEEKAAKYMDDIQTKLSLRNKSITGTESHTISTARIIPNTEIGVGGFVRAIQSIDAAVMAEIYKQFPIFHVFDAYMTGTRQIQEVTEVAQKAFFDVNSRYSVVDAISDRTVDFINLVTETHKVKPFTAKQLESFFPVPLPPEELPAYFESHTEEQRIELALERGQDRIGEIDETQSFNKANRDEWLSRIGVVNQFSKSSAPYRPHPKQGSQENEVFSGSYDYEFNKYAKQRYSNTLNQQTLKNILEDTKKFVDESALDNAHQEQLDHVVDFVIDPGLTHIDDVVFELTKNPDGTLNKGKMRASGLQPQGIYAEAAGNKRTSTVDMSAQETIVHEMVHAVTYNFLEGGDDYWARNEAQNLFDKAKANVTWEAFLPDKNNPTEYEKEAAKRRWKYIFENKEGNQLHEFVSIGLTNKQFAQALADIPYISKDETLADIKNPKLWKSDFLQQLWNVFAKALEWISGSARQYKQGKGNLQSNLLELTKAVVAINAQESAKVQSRMASIWHRGNKAWENRTQWANDKVRQIVKGKGSQVVMKWATGKEYSEDKAEGRVKAGIKYTADKHREALQILSEEWEKSGVPKPSFKLGTAIWNDIKGLTKEDMKNWRNLKRYATTKVDTLRKRVADTVQDQISKAFGRKLTRRERKALNDVFLRTDLSSLFKTYTLQEIMGFIDNPDQLRTAIGNATSEIRQEYGRNGIAYSHQAKNLGLLISRNELLENVLMPQTNAHNIAQLKMFDKESREPRGNLEEAERMIDELASLHALQYTDPALKRELGNLVDSEMNREDGGNGFATFMAFHNAHKDFSLEKNFHGNKIGTYKGYTEENYNQDVKIAYKPITEEWQTRMRADGYRLVGKLPRDPIHQKVTSDKRPRGIYVNDMGLGRYRGQITSLTNPQARGTDLISDLTENMGVLGKVRAEKEIEVVTKKAHKGALRQFREDLDTETRNQATLVPILSQETGEVMNLRYMMSDAKKQELLKRDDYGDSNLGRMFGKVHDKNNSKDVNREVVSRAHEEWLKLRDDPQVKFRYIGLDTKTKEQQEAFRMLPSDMQYAAEKVFGRQGMYVREDLYNYIMGFREISLADKLHKMEQKYAQKNDRHARIPLVAYKSLRFAEDLWKEMIEAARVKTSVLLPDVVFGNIFSNVLVLAADGIPPNFIFSKAAEGLHAMKKYEKDRLRRDQLQHEIMADLAQGKDVSSKQIESTRLQRNLEASPVHEMIEEGMFQVITEDIGQESFETTPAHKPIRRKLNEWSEKLEEKTPETLKFASYTKEALMMPGSTIFAKVMKANQYGDFVARYVKYKYDTEVKKKDKQTAIDESMDFFIYYDEPSDPSLTAINDYGIFMFWKFYARIQRVAFKLFTEKPATMAMATITDSVLLDYDQGIAHYLGNIFKAWDRTAIIPEPIDNFNDARRMPIFDWMSLLIPGWNR
jgi:hypothetical protein